MRHFTFGAVARLVAFTAISLLPASPADAAPKAPPVAPVQAARGPGEIRINVYGPNPEQNASTRCPAMFQLFRNGQAVFSNWNFVSGTLGVSPFRATGGLEAVAYSEGETLYIKGLPAGVYDLHFSRRLGVLRPGDMIRPVHISGIVVEAGKVSLLEELRIEVGSTLAQIGKPAILPEPAVNIVDRFNALAERFNALVEQLGGVQARLEKEEKDNAELRDRLRRLESHLASK